MRRIAALVVGLGLVAVVGACAKDADRGPGAATGVTGATAASGSTSGASGSTSASGATGSTDQSTSAGPSVEPGTDLEDGRHFGFIQTLDEAGLMAFDLAYFLTGDEATQAAIEHGDEAPPPNDYYIVNDNPRLRTLTIAPDVAIVLLDWNRCCDHTISPDLATFAQVISAGDDLVEIDGQTYYGRLSPYWITVQGGEVTMIEEQYLP